MSMDMVERVKRSVNNCFVLFLMKFVYLLIKKKKYCLLVLDKDDNILFRVS